MAEKTIKDVIEEILSRDGNVDKKEVERLEKELSKSRNENLSLEEQVKSLKNTISFHNTIYKDNNHFISDGVKEFFSNLREGISDKAVYGLLALAYGAEAYFLGTRLNDKMYSLAKSWFTGYGNFNMAAHSERDKIGFPMVQGMMHIISDGAAGLGVGAITGLAVGGTTILTYNMVKERNFAPIETVTMGSILCGLGGVAGGIIGAWFSDPTGIMIGSYIGSGLVLAKGFKDGVWGE